jgi:hypothetical protein
MPKKEMNKRKQHIAATSNKNNSSPVVCSAARTQIRFYFKLTVAPLTLLWFCSQLGRCPVRALLLFMVHEHTQAKRRFSTGKYFSLSFLPLNRILCFSAISSTKDCQSARTSCEKFGLSGIFAKTTATNQQVVR